MDERDLIYDWNNIEPEAPRDPRPTLILYGLTMKLSVMVSKAPVLEILR